MKVLYVWHSSGQQTTHYELGSHPLLFSWLKTITYPSYVTGCSRHNGPWWKEPAGYPLPFCSMTVTFFIISPWILIFFPLCWNYQASEQTSVSSCNTCQHYFTKDAPVHTEYTPTFTYTHKQNTVCKCTYRVWTQLEELIRESMGPDNDQEQIPTKL